MRYLLFAGYNYYPSGGWDDFVGSYSDLMTALGAAANLRQDWWHIVDIVTMDIVKSGNKG
jgi:hypothetical protein